MDAIAYASESNESRTSKQLRSHNCDFVFWFQVKLFHDWFSGWSDDQKNYLVLRLKDIDAGFYSKYEERASDPTGAAASKEKDYFEPGIPPELINTPTIVKGEEEEKENESVNANEEEEDEDLKKKKVSTSSTPAGLLSPISEDN